MHQIPLSLQIAIARARMWAKRHVQRAVEILVAARVSLDSAIAAVARFHAAAVRSAT